jgi:hypothetical protein
MKDSSKIPLKKEKQTIEKKIFSTYRQLSTSWIQPTVATKYLKKMTCTEFSQNFFLGLYPK